MTNEERDLIEKFVARVGGAAQGGGVFQRSVPATQPQLAPIDPEADRFIAEQFQSHPEARYRITQMAVVQEAALAEAGTRLQRMQAEIDSLRQQQQQQQQAPQPGQSRGFLGGLFSGGASQPQPQAPVWNQGPAQGAPQYAQPGAMPPPNYPPGVQPGMFQRSGSGFLGSALGTAAGVAGGVVAGNLLMDMFSGHGAGGGFGGGFGGGGMGGGFGGAPSETIINNNYGDAAPPDQGGGMWDNASQGGGTDPAWDNSTQGDSGGGWDDNSGGSGGGFDDNSL